MCVCVIGREKVSVWGLVCERERERGCVLRQGTVCLSTRAIGSVLEINRTLVKYRFVSYCKRLSHSHSLVVVLLVLCVRAKERERNCVCLWVCVRERERVSKIVLVKYMFVS